MEKIFLITVTSGSPDYTFLYLFFLGVILFAVIALMLPDRERDERNKQKEASWREETVYDFLAEEKKPYNPNVVVD